MPYNASISYKPDVSNVAVPYGEGHIHYRAELPRRLLLFWFAQFEVQMRFTVMYEVRTETIPRAR